MSCAMLRDPHDSHTPPPGAVTGPSALDPPPPRWLTADEAAARLRMSRRAFYMAIRRGQIPLHRLGRRLRFDPMELDAAVRRV